MNKKDSRKNEDFNITLTFFGLITIYTLILNGDVGIKEIGLMLIFTLIFWLLKKF